MIVQPAQRGERPTKTNKKIARARDEGRPQRQWQTVKKGRPERREKEKMKYQRTDKECIVLCGRSEQCSSLLRWSEFACC
jgi:hypothetical protein